MRRTATGQQNGTKQRMKRAGKDKKVTLDDHGVVQEKPSLDISIDHFFVGLCSLGRLGI